MPEYLFYPGCSLQRSARPYLDSINAIRDFIALELKEVQDWNCCGATEYISIHHLAAPATSTSPKPTAICRPTRTWPNRSTQRWLRAACITRRERCGCGICWTSS
jgi:hypothetical protein